LAVNAIAQPTTVSSSLCVDHVPMAPVGAPAMSMDPMLVSPPPTIG
jgi:hypothetical protein